ncbi:hypothetical protein CLOAM1450 [Candidatus Cloacimonas acidaminovorans str. Evry]|uniref:Uncharacterized protein n=1 Tax=Cloacimonas acidaminovorans (strain Evry) TaxID=459349 RepID=B0VJ90_CLOAI|nr:hypothetical protein CLOAM1450 [Candidatus Cloacimonas acidaminovorans str. Evry]
MCWAQSVNRHSEYGLVPDYRIKNEAVPASLSENFRPLCYSR